MRTALAIGLFAALAGPGAAQEALHPDLGVRSHDAACGACPYRGARRAPFGTRGPLADDGPDEVLLSILFGAAPEEAEGGMPAFSLVLSDSDILRIAVWLRGTRRPEAPWPDLPARLAWLRATGARDD